MARRPSPTVVETISKSVQKISQLNEEYGKACATYQQRLAEIPVTEGAKVMALSSEHQARQIELDNEITRLIEEMNRNIDEVDASLAAWLKVPLQSAKPQ